MILIAVFVGFVGPFDFDADVVGLFLSEGGEMDAKGGQVETRHFFVEVFGQDADGLAVFFGVLVQIDLGQDLVGEGI